jgi:tetratricopeptide (TPR) repeat protein
MSLCDTLQVLPSSTNAYTNLAVTLTAAKQTEEAAAQYERATLAAADEVKVRDNLGIALARLERDEEALAHYQSALAINPNLAEAHNNLGYGFQTLGQLQEARKAFERAVALAPRQAAFYFGLAASKRFTAGDPHLLAMEALAEDIGSLSIDERTKLHFALGKAYADIGRHDRAYRHLLHGNALKRRQIDYNEAETLPQLEHIEAEFTPALMRRHAGHGDPSPVPIFIVGMPRSGTTLVEQVLASHPSVHGAGELRDFDTLVDRLWENRGISAPYPGGVSTLAAAELRSLGELYIKGLRRRSPCGLRTKV